MPKEYVFQRNKHGDPATDENVLKIGWGRDLEYVEVASVSTRKNEAICRFDEETKTWEPIGPEDEQGFYVCINNRRDLNRLIADLKRARDHSFGRDE